MIKTNSSGRNSYYNSDRHLRDSLSASLISSIISRGNDGCKHINVLLIAPVPDYLVDISYSSDVIYF